MPFGFDDFSGKVNERGRCGLYKVPIYGLLGSSRFFFVDKIWFLWQLSLVVMRSACPWANHYE